MVRPGPTQLITDLRTNIRGFFTYILVEYLDPRRDTPVDGMQYEDNPIVNCSMHRFELVQPMTDPFQVVVCSASPFRGGANL